MNHKGNLEAACSGFFALLLFGGIAAQAIAAEPEDITARRNLYDCQTKAAEYTYNLDRAGDQAIFDKHLQACMETKKPVLRSTMRSGSGLNLPTSIPVCTDKDALWCSPCWLSADPVNYWCGLSRETGNAPGCGPATYNCRFSPGAWDSGNENNEVQGCVNICQKAPKNYGGATSIRITNNTNEDVTVAFVTGALSRPGSSGACSQEGAIISYEWVAANTTWCKNPTKGSDEPNAGWCTGIVPANRSVDVKRPDSDRDKCLTGAIMLGGKLSCPGPKGFTQGEFTLNPTGTDVEAVDISLVNGANYAMSVKLPGEAWGAQDSPTAKVTLIGPSGGLEENNNKPGIFPPGCTDCTNAVTGKIPCPGITPNPKCQPSPSCNIQRGNATGGTIEFIIERKL